MTLTNKDLDRIAERGVRGLSDEMLLTMIQALRFWWYENRTLAIEVAELKSDLMILRELKNPSCVMCGTDEGVHHYCLDCLEATA